MRPLAEFPNKAEFFGYDDSILVEPSAFKGSKAAFVCTNAAVYEHLTAVEARAFAKALLRFAGPVKRKTKPKPKRKAGKKA